MEINEQFFDKNKSKKITEKDLLSEDERVLWKGCPKKLSYVLGTSAFLIPIAIAWGLIDIGMITMMYVNFVKDQPLMLLFIIPFFALHLAPVWILIFKIIHSNNIIKQRYYIITNFRIIEIAGQGKSPCIANTILLSDLKSATIHKDIFDKMLRVGDIRVYGQKSSLVIYDIADVDFIYSKINEIIKGNKADLFYENGKICSHCGSLIKKDSIKCPNCGGR